MPDQEAQFNEVLAITVSKEKFAESLADIKTAYLDWVADMEGKAPGSVGVGMFAGLQKEISNVMQAVQGLTGAFNEFSGETTAAANQGAEALAAVASKVDLIQAENAAKQQARVEQEIDGINQIAAARQALAEGSGSLPQTAGRDKKEARFQDDRTTALDDQQAKLAEQLEAEYAYTDKLIELAEKRADASKAMDEELSVEREAILNKYYETFNANLEKQQEAEYAYTDRLIANAEKRADAAKVLDEEIQVRHQGMLDEELEQTYAQTDRLIAASIKRAEAAQELDEEIQLEHQRVLDEEVEATYQQTDRLIAAAEKRASAAKALDEEIQIGHQRALSEYTAAQEAAEEKAVAAAEAAAKKMQAIHEKGFENFGKQLLQITEFVVLWRVIGSLVQGVTDLLSSPFKALEDGVKYTRELEAKADELRGVLQANVQYSADLAENFRQASVAAPEIVKAFQDAAIATHTKPDQLTNIFKSLADNGAAAGVKDTKELIDLATDLGVAFKASGRNANTIQRAVSEIPKFLEGSLPHGAALLQVLDLSAEAAKKLVAEGLKNQDLLERIGNLPAMKAHQLALASMKDDWQSASGQLSLYIERLEAAGASELSEKLSGWLRELNTWISQNEGKLTSSLRTFAEVMLDLGSGLANMVLQLGKIPASMGVLTALGVSLQGIAFAAQLAANGFEHMMAGRDPKKLEEANKSFLDIMSQNKKAVDDLLGTNDNGDTTGPSESRSLHRKITSKTEPRTEPAKLARQSFGEEKKAYDDDKANVFAYVESVKEKYRELDNAVAESTASKTLSHKEAAEQVRVNGEAEIAELAKVQDALAAEAVKYREKLVKEPFDAKNKQRHDDAIGAFDKDQTNTGEKFSALNQQIRNQISAAQKAANAEDATQAENASKHLISLREESAKTELAYVKLLAQEGYLDKVDAFDKETALILKQRQIKIDVDNEELSHFGAHTTEYANIVAKKSLAEQQFTDQSKLRTQERIALLEKEADDKRKQDALVRADQYEAQAVSATNPGTLRADQEALYNLRRRNLELLIEEKQASLEVAAAKNVESDETKRLQHELQALFVDRTKDAQGRAEEIARTVPQPALRNMIDRSTQAQAVDDARYNVDNARYNLGAFNNAHENDNFSDPAVERARDAFVAAVTASETALANLTTQYNKSAETWGQAGNKLINFLAGMNVKNALDAASKADAANGGKGGGVTGHDNEIGAYATIGANVFKSVANAAKTYEAGQQAGGTIGGVGALTSQFGAMIPGIGGVIASAAGTIMSTIGEILTAAAKHIAVDIETQNKKTMAAYANHQADLAATLAAVKQEEASAISRLSGLKGGQDELNKILPDLQAQVASLEFQQRQTLATFQSSLDSLRLHSDTLTTINQEWVQINQQVADYLAAGGDAAAAQEYLSLQLQQIQKTSNETLNQGHDQAVQDAIQLNGLLQQKLTLTQQYNQQVFDVTNKDSIERRAGSIQTGQQLAQITSTYNAQLVALDAQIDLTTQKVTLESTVFTIAQNISDLHAQDNALQIAALDLQILKYTDLQKIVAGISSNGGLFSATPGLFNALPTTINVQLQLSGYTLTATGTINPNGTTNVLPPSSSDIGGGGGDRVSQEAVRRARMASS
jgi:hypothetical protein